VATKDSLPVIRPENIMPVDALHVLQEKMLDPRAYGSCSMHVQGKCLGCPAFDTCEEPEKGSKRPENYGVRIVKSASRGGGIREDVMACFAYWRQKEGQEAAGALMDIVAREGEEITIRISKPTVLDAKGVRVPGTPYEDSFDTIKVPEFKGIDKNLRLVNDAYRATIFQKHHEKERAEKRREAMAPPAGSVPTETPGDDTAGKPKRR
jgi:hypothetical protein